MSAWYELSSTSNDKHAFVLKAANAEVILTSQHYAAKDSAKAGIASVRENAADAAQFESLVATDARFYFTLKAANGQVIGTSQMYTTESARAVGMASVHANGSTSDVREV
jgi:uncharacterized protein YegP (UPF0339 family)